MTTKKVRAPKGWRIVTRGLVLRGDYCSEGDGTDFSECTLVGCRVMPSLFHITYRKVARPKTGKKAK